MIPAGNYDAKAVALGMTRTFFRNPNGLPDPLQHTTTAFARWKTSRLRPSK